MNPNERISRIDNEVYRLQNELAGCRDASEKKLISRRIHVLMNQRIMLEKEASLLDDIIRSDARSATVQTFHSLVKPKVMRT